MTRHRPLSLLAALGLVLGLGPALAETSALTVTLTDGVVAPQTIELPADTAATLTVVNAGATPAEFESKQLRIETIIAPGQTTTIELQPLPAGSYSFVEEFHENLDTARGTIVAK